MAQYFPPAQNQTEPGLSLTDPDHPCLPQCRNEHEQLALLVFLLAAYLDAGTPAELEAATAKFRNLSKSEMLTFMSASFTDVLIATATPEALACLECYSDQKLKEMFIYLWQILLQVP